MTARTPGPWNTSRDAVPQGHTQITIYTESGLGERVATAFISEANASLIAAAPDLLAVAKFISANFAGSVKALADDAIAKAVQP